MRRIVSLLILALLTIDVLIIIEFNVKPSGAWTGTIYIKADGSVYPPGAPIQTSDNVTYTLTGNITSYGDGIIIQKDNIILDGAGYTIKGSKIYPYEGIYLSGRVNVTVRNIKVTSFYYGIYLYTSSNNNIVRCDVTDSYDGIDLLYYSSNNRIEGNKITNIVERSISIDRSSNNVIIGNNIVKGRYGVYIGILSSNNIIYHNNFINNTYQAISDSPNIWDNGYPSGGNFWSNYNGVDANRDGIGDTPHVINVDNKDNYPLMHPYGSIVNLNTNLVYLTIQSAINAPETLDGHTILVKAGTYYENIEVNKSLTLVGENRRTVIDGSQAGAVVSITANNVTITGFTVRNSSNGGAGIWLGWVSHCNITKNTITNNGFGIKIFLSSNNCIMENTITNNGEGIYSDDSSNNTFEDNIVTNNWYGVYLIASDNNIICGNYIADNDYGVFLSNSDNTIVSANNIVNNEYGIYVGSSNNIMYHNNFINNTQQVDVSPGETNNWDYGYPSGGNYWSDYKERYPNAKELRGSGLWDTPYAIDEYNQDRYPLMYPYGTLTFKLTITTTVGGTTTPSPGVHTYPNGATVSVTANPGENYVFSHWILDGINVGSQNPIEIYVTASHTLHAVFQQATFQLTITSTSGGTTNPPPGTYTYASGTLLNVTAIPDTGYVFAYWLLDGNVRMENPITILMDVNHILEAYFVDNIPPEIGEPSQFPPPENVQPYQEVTVIVTVTDYGSGVKNATLLYSINDGATWTTSNMTEIAANTYQATILGYGNCTWVTYKIVAYDKAGNMAVNDNHGYCYQYHVIPEFPSTTLSLLILMFATIIATVLGAKEKSTYLLRRGKLKV